MFEATRAVAERRRGSRARAEGRAEAAYGHFRAAARLHPDRVLAAWYWVQAAAEAAAIEHRAEQEECAQQALAPLTARTRLTRLGREVRRDALVLLADALTALGRLVEAEAAARRALAAAETPQDRLAALGVLAQVHHRRGDAVAAHRTAGLVVAAARELGVPVLAAASWCDLALAAFGVGDAAAAQDACDRAAALLDGMPRGERGQPELALLTLRSMLARHRGDTEAAFTYARAAVEQAERMGAAEQTVETRITLALALAEAGQPEAAVGIMAPDFRRAERDGPRPLAGRIAMNLAACCSMLGDDAQAARWARNGVDQLAAGEDSFGLAGALHNLGTLLVGTGRAQEAETLLLESVRRLEHIRAAASLERHDIGMLDVHAQVYRSLQLARAARGDAPGALDAALRARGEFLTRERADEGSAHPDRTGEQPPANTPARAARASDPASPDDPARDRTAPTRAADEPALGGQRTSPATKTDPPAREPAPPTAHASEPAYADRPVRDRAAPTATTDERAPAGQQTSATTETDQTTPPVREPAPPTAHVGDPTSPNHPARDRTAPTATADEPAAAGQRTSATTEAHRPTPLARERTPSAAHAGDPTSPDHPTGVRAGATAGTDPFVRERGGVLVEAGRLGRRFVAGLLATRGPVPAVAVPAPATPVGGYADPAAGPPSAHEESAARLLREEAERSGTVFLVTGLLGAPAEGDRFGIPVAVDTWVVAPGRDIALQRVSLDGLARELVALEAESEPTGLDVWRRAGYRPAGAAATEAHRALMSRVLEMPLAKAAQAAAECGQRLVILPDGFLHTVPFPALQLPDGKLLVEHCAVSVLPAPRLLRRTAPAPLDRPPVLLAVGDPAPATAEPAPAMPAPGLARLPGARAEAAALAEEFGTTALTGTAATRAAVTAGLPGCDLAHFAAHALQGGDAFVPGMLCLAPSDRDDGYLRADDIARLTLAHCRLVVLSACSSGLGRATFEGNLGLARAFLTAGAATVVVSLWDIPDADTGPLMSAFYARLRAGEPAAQALRTAVLSARAAGADPAAWSAFVLIGDPNTRL